MSRGPRGRKPPPGTKDRSFEKVRLGGLFRFLLQYYFLTPPFRVDCFLISLASSISGAIFFNFSTNPDKSYSLLNFPLFNALLSILEMRPADSRSAKCLWICLGLRPSLSLKACLLGNGFLPASHQNQQAVTELLTASG